MLCYLLLSSSPAWFRIRAKAQSFQAQGNHLQEIHLHTLGTKGYIYIIWGSLRKKWGALECIKQLPESYEGLEAEAWGS